MPLEAHWDSGCQNIPKFENSYSSTLELPYLYILFKIMGSVAATDASRHQGVNDDMTDVGFLSSRTKQLIYSRSD